MDTNAYLTSVNRTVGENARWARNYLGQQQSAATPDAATAGTSAGAGASSATGDLNSQMMLLMMQLLMKLMDGGLGNAAYPASYNSSLSPPASSNGKPLPPVNNPAYQFVDSRLRASAPAGGTVDLKDNASIQRRIDALNAQATADPAADAIYARLGEIDGDSPEAQTLYAQLDERAQTPPDQTPNPQTQQELHLLQLAQQINTNIDQLKTKPDLEARTLSTDLNNVREDLIQQWNKLAPASAPDSALATDVKAALAAGQFRENELGQALKFMLDQAPAGQLPQIQQLLGALVKSGDININAFLGNNYLSHLSTERKTALKQAMLNAGLQLDSGKPNARLAGFILETLANPKAADSQSFLQSWLQAAYDQASQNPRATESKTLARLLYLADVSLGDDGKTLAFAPADPAAEYV